MTAKHQITRESQLTPAEKQILPLKKEVAPENVFHKAWQLARRYAEEVKNRPLSG